MIHSFYNKQSKYSIDKYYDSDYVIKINCTISIVENIYTKFSVYILSIYTSPMSVLH